MNKQLLRKRISTVASFIEIMLSVLLLGGILIHISPIILDLRSLIFDMSDGIMEHTASEFLSNILQLIIGIEFVKMLVKHSIGSAVEVLLFAIARKIITDHGGMYDLLLGVVAFALLLVAKKFLTMNYQATTYDGFLVNAGMEIEKINKKFNFSIPITFANTLAGLIYKDAKEKNKKVDVGYEIELDKEKLEIYSMDGEIIKQVKIEKKEN